MKNTIVGSVINNIKIADDNLALLFQLDDEDIVLKVDGDCCSQSWIEYVTLPESFPALVLAVEVGEGADQAPEDDDEVLQCSKLNIVTDKGTINIDYRNLSNGYYSGNLHWPWDRYYYGGVFGQNVSTEQWIDVTVKPV
jgi:hypothetical protein